MKASVRDIRISPKKPIWWRAWYGINLPRSSQYLALVNKRGAEIIKKVIDSAIANAKTMTESRKMRFLISRIVVTKEEHFVVLFLHLVVVGSYKET